MLKYAKRLKITWFAFLAVCALIFFVQDVIAQSVGLNTIFYGVIIVFSIAQLRDVIRHNDET